MKITKMRNKKNEVLSTDVVLAFERELKLQFSKAGFLTNVAIITRTAVKIGLHMRSFSLDLTKHSRNLQLNPYKPKLTNLPTWDQRVEFNDIVNNAMDKFKLSGNIKSGPYTIRQGFKSFNEQDWENQKPEWVYSNEAKGYMIESVNEQEHLNNRKAAKNLAARIKREEYKKTKEYQNKQFIKKADKLINSNERA